MDRQQVQLVHLSTTTTQLLLASKRQNTSLSDRVPWTFPDKPRVCGWMGVAGDEHAPEDNAKHAPWLQLQD